MDRSVVSSATFLSGVIIYDMELPLANGNILIEYTTSILKYKCNAYHNEERWQ